jgi:Tfp pilus assembly protein PilO
VLLSRDKTQISIYMVGTLLIADFVWFGILPSRERLNGLRQSKAQQVEIIEKANELRAQLPGLRRQLNEHQGHIADIDAKVPIHKSVGSFLEVMSALMTRHGLTEQMIMPGSEQTGLMARELPITVQCSGRLEQLFDFYRDLEGARRLIGIDQIQLENDPNASGRVSMNTQLVIYYQLTENTGSTTL